MKNIKFVMKFVVTTLFLLFVFSRTGLTQEFEISWVEGPATVDLGNNLAEVSIDENYIFANADDTQLIMEQAGNIVSNNEVGLILPIAEDADWFIVFEYEAIGYVKDDEKDSIDADAILESIKAGTEEANKIKAEKGIPALNIIGWYEEPHYDEKTHDLTWTILADTEENGEKYQLVNYNINVLGRTGYMSVVLVADPTTLDSIKPELEAILSTFSYKQGKKYTEFKEGDKIAEYGLTALVAGGVGAAAAKMGLFQILAKYAKIIFLAVIAFFGALWKKIKNFFGGGNQSETPTTPM